MEDGDDDNESEKVMADGVHSSGSIIYSFLLFLSLVVINSSIGLDESNFWVNIHSTLSSVIYFLF